MGALGDDFGGLAASWGSPGGSSAVPGWSLGGPGEVPGCPGEVLGAALGGFGGGWGEQPSKNSPGSNSLSRLGTKRVPKGSPRGVIL